MDGLCNNSALSAIESPSLTNFVYNIHSTRTNIEKPITRWSKTFTFTFLDIVRITINKFEQRLSFYFKLVWQWENCWLIIQLYYIIVAKSKLNWSFQISLQQNWTWCFIFWKEDITAWFVVNICNIQHKPLAYCLISVWWVKFWLDRIVYCHKSL